MAKKLMEINNNYLKDERSRYMVPSYLTLKELSEAACSAPDSA
jgi:hypothetical protein